MTESELEQHTASSFENALELLYWRSWSDKLGRYRSRYAFRGLSAADYELETALMRLGGEYARLEGHLLRNFEKYAHESQAGVYFSPWKWLTVGQHHGLPTRLLDWTFSPMVALHFATANTEKASEDGVVWCVNYRRCHRLAPAPLRDLLEEAGSDVFTVGMLEETVGDLDSFGQLGDDPFVIFFEPPSMDRRIVNQYALHSVASDPRLVQGEWLEAHPELARRVVIPAEVKWEIRDKLDQANVTERVLFPGLDGLASWLERHYSPKSEQARGPDASS